MEMEKIIMYAGVGIMWTSALYWAYRRYKLIMADGVITREEVIDAVTDGADIIINTIFKTEELASMKKVDLVVLCREHGLYVSGTKAQLIERLQEL